MTPEEVDQNKQFIEAMDFTAAKVGGRSWFYLEGFLSGAAREYAYAYDGGFMDRRAMGQMAAVLEELVKRARG